jgi:hypothetical protein
MVRERVFIPWLANLFWQFLKFDGAQSNLCNVLKTQDDFGKCMSFAPHSADTTAMMGCQGK